MRKQVNMIGNLISYFAFCGLGFLVLFFSSSIKAESVLFPRILGYTLILLNLGLIFTTLLEWTSQKNKQKLVEKKEKIENIANINQKPIYEVYPFFAIVFCIIFIVGFERIGFDLSAFILTFATMILINPKGAFRKFYIALIIPLILILIFKIGLDLRMPLFIEKFLR